MNNANPSIRRILTLTALAVLPVACVGGDRGITRSANAGSPFLAAPFEIAEDAFTVGGNLGQFAEEVQLEEVDEDLYELRVRIEAPQPETPPRFSIRWSLPAVDIGGFWNTNLSLDRINYYRNSVESRSTSGAPVLSLYNPGDMNRLTVAVSDALNPVGLRSSVREEDARFYFTLTFCSERMPQTTVYEAVVRIDARGIPYYEALSAVSDWWAGQPGYEPAPVPDDALRPVYSTWYSFHQNLDVEEVLAELQLSAEMGFEVVIVDDGWQTLDNQRGYRFTGDWKPERIPDMKGFVDAVHELGMKFMLWYSVPLVGEESEAYSRFQGKYLRHWESQGAYVLDPRYPEVREFIIGTYLQAMEDWGLDGFKLDFIGMLAANESTVLTAEEGRDYASVNEAADRLLTDVMSRLRERNPEILIEFRQPYNGPLMRKYGNMFRGVDAPNNAWANRVEVTDVRLLGGNTAPHSDMFMWHPTEPLEAAALQFLNVLFSVPQVSVKLTQFPESHRDMVAAWTQYWKENRDVLMQGEFIPTGPGSAYPVILAHREGKAIAGVYSDAVVRLPNTTFDAVDLVNAKATGSLIVELFQPMGRVEVVTFDTRGQEVGRDTRSLGASIHRFEAPPVRAGGDPATMTSSPPNGPGISPLELARLLEAGEPIQIMDVRAPERVAQGRIDLLPEGMFHNIRGSVLLGLPSLLATGLDPDLPVVVVCGKGKDSASVAAHMNRLGGDASSLTGGLTDWMGLTLPRRLDPPEGVDALIQFDRIGTGCLGYLLVSKGEALIIDPPLRADAFLDALKEAGADLVGVADTHIHADYISGGPRLSQEYGVPYFLHPADAFFPYDGTPGKIEYSPVSDGQQIPFGEAALDVVHTPGHTEGSVTFLAEDRVAFTGDFLFVESIGRPDLAGKESVWAGHLWESVERALRDWDDGLAVYPAHYASPTERRMGQAVGDSFGSMKEGNEFLQKKGKEDFLRRILAQSAPFPEAYRKIKAMNLGLAPIVQTEVEELEVGRNECALGGV